MSSHWSPHSTSKCVPQSLPLPPRDLEATHWPLLERVARIASARAPKAECQCTAAPFSAS